MVKRIGTALFELYRSCACLTCFYRWSELFLICFSLLWLISEAGASAAGVCAASAAAVGIGGTGAVSAAAAGVGDTGTVSEYAAAAEEPKYDGDYGDGTDCIIFSETHGDVSSFKLDSLT